MMFLIEKPSGFKAYYSFRRLIKEERIEEICAKSGDKVPVKNNLPKTIAYNQITIRELEVDERL
jgi:hypothetical protein